MSWTFLLAVTALCAATANGFATGEQPNLVKNPGFEEGASKHNIPAGWTTWAPFENPTIELSSKLGYEGTHSAYIETQSDLTAFLVSEPIPVAPGEHLTLTAWCRTQDVSTTMGGTYGINAGFMDAHKRYTERAKWQPLPVQDGKWFAARCETQVPDGTAYCTFQIGVKQMSGKFWWDCARLESSSTVAMRFDLASRNAEPGVTTLPLVVINRAPKGAPRIVSIVSEPGHHAQTIQLGGDQQTSLPSTFTLNKRGKLQISARLLDSSGGQPLFSATEKLTIPKLLVSEPVLPVYFCVEDGKPRLEQRLWIHEPEASRQKMTLECALYDADAPLTAAPHAKWSSSQLPPNPIRIEMTPEKPLPQGDYRLVSTLKQGEKVVTSSTEDWHIRSRKESAVTLNSDGFLVVEGKPFFPIGLFDNHMMAEEGAAGFNVTQNYDVGHVRQGLLPDNQRMKRMLDDSLSNGMRHLFLVTHGEGCRWLNDEYLRRVRMFRDHPGVLCWYEEEGVARGDTGVELVQQLHDTLKRVAPEHPFVVGDSRDVVTRVKDRSLFFPDQWMDVGIWWWYPIPIRQGGRPGAYEGEEETNGNELVPPTFLTLAKTNKPIWVALQSYKKPIDGGRFPTPTEYRAQAYLAVIHGAKGLFYYVGSGMNGNGVQNKKEEGHWEALKALVGELRQISPVFMAPDAQKPAKAVSPQNALISVRTKQVDGKRVVLACNRSDKPAQVRFQAPELGGEAKLSVRFENRYVQGSKEEFTDAFGPYAVHVYELP